jgi:hypothetical protein
MEDIHREIERFGQSRGESLLPDQSKDETLGRCDVITEVLSDRIAERLWKLHCFIIISIWNVFDYYLSVFVYVEIVCFL